MRVNPGLAAMALRHKPPKLSETFARDEASGTQARKSEASHARKSTLGLHGGGGGREPRTLEHIYPIVAMYAPRSPLILAHFLIKLMKTHNFEIWGVICIFLHV